MDSHVATRPRVFAEPFVYRRPPLPGPTLALGVVPAPTSSPLVDCRFVRPATPFVSIHLAHLCPRFSGGSLVGLVLVRIPLPGRRAGVRRRGVLADRAEPATRIDDLALGVSQVGLAVDRRFGAAGTGSQGGPRGFWRACRFISGSLRSSPGWPLEHLQAMWAKRRSLWQDRDLNRSVEGRFSA